MTTDIAIARAAIAARWSAAQVPTAVAVALAQSGGNAEHSTATERGLWGLAPAIAPANWSDPAANAAAAKALYDRGGWLGFAGWRNQKYLLYMPRGAAASAAAAAADAIGQVPLPEVPNPLEPVQDAAREAARTLRVIGDRDLWIRAGLAILGALILVAATVALLWSLVGPGVKKAAGAAVGAVGPGRLAKGAAAAAK